MRISPRGVPWGLAIAQSPSRSHVPVGAKCTNCKKGLNCNRVLFAAYTTIWLFTSLTLLNPAPTVARFLYDSFIHYFTPVYPDAVHARVRAPHLLRNWIEAAFFAPSRPRMKQ